MWSFILNFLVASSLGLEVSPEEASAVGAVPPGYAQFTFAAYIDNWDYSYYQYPLRYYINTYYWNANQPGPIFFFCGGSAPIETFISTTGYIDYLAQQMQAIVVYAEHRYFGGSLPFGNKTYAPYNMKYLSPHQALADWAYLITNLKAIYQNVPVIAWGGGYGGMLSAWMRMTYSNLIDGAIASSAPVLYFNGTVDPNAFNAFVTSQYASVAPECPAYIASAFDYLESFYLNTTEYTRLQDTFETCNPVAEPEDVGLIVNWLQNSFTDMTLYNYPYPSNTIFPLPANPLTVACSYFNGVDITNVWEVLTAVRNAANVYYNYTGLNSCSNTYNPLSNGNFGNQQGWSYLLCSSLNFPFGSIKTTSMFGDEPFDQVAINNDCFTLWGRTPQINYASQWYGASNNPAQTWQYASNIVFSNGGLDPWQVGCITKSFGTSVVAFVAKGAAFMMDLRLPNAADPSDLAAARATEKTAIQYWLNG
ncbi:unnamed protein product [Blepharisma stoltei]|uniref:Lysosomal Pro-X carboxypeptidase n=1 Tax=Blepharisma stoltei TaxID=1481888 RepID=A0AAU9IDM7_9CILI|nr:unnamed protein product [Blepharisma stoltei]